jgi:hypothetical protein
MRVSVDGVPSIPTPSLIALETQYQEEMRSPRRVGLKHIADKRARANDSLEDHGLQHFVCVLTWAATQHLYRHRHKPTWRVNREATNLTPASIRHAP